MKDPLKPKLHFFRTTLVGGILFLLPISALVIILAKPLEIAHKLVAPFAEKLPFDSVVGLETPAILAILLIVLFCFLAGILAQTSLAKMAINKIESSVLSNIPGYELIKGMSMNVLGKDSAATFPVVMLNIDGIRQIALLIEPAEDGLVTVFVPDAPSPRSGGVFIVPAECTTPLDVPLMSAVKCLKSFGTGSLALRSGLPSNQ